MAKKITSEHPRQKHFIKEWREYRGMSVDRLAEEIGATRVSVYRIEKGEQPYTQDTLEAISFALRVDRADLISRSPESAEETSLFDLPVGDRVYLTPDEKERVAEFAKFLEQSRTSTPSEGEPPRNSPKSRAN